MNKVFISYSHCDTSYLNSLKRHFKPLSKNIDFWDDSRILAGQKWREEIERALSNCKVAILLISADFFNSDFIERVELPKLLSSAENNGTTILSVILKPCLFTEYPEINKFQAINSPSQTVAQMNEYEQEQLWVNLSLRIKQLIA